MKSVNLAFALCLCVLGCTSPDADPAETAPVYSVPSGNTIFSNAGRYEVIYRSDPSPVPTGELFGISVWIRDAETGELLDDVELVVDASMPQHQHGMNVKPQHSRVSAGRFQVDDLLFHMPGEWTLTFDLEREGVSERAQAVLDAN